MPDPILIWDECDQLIIFDDWGSETQPDPDYSVAVEIDRVLSAHNVETE